MRLFRVVDTQTGAEPGLEEFALREPWAKGLIYCDMQGFSVEEDGTASSRGSVRQPRVSAARTVQGRVAGPARSRR
jgi:hypothetical protein